MAAFEKELSVVLPLVLDVGETVMAWYGRVETELKAGNEPVTAADREANDLLVAGLAAAFPGDGILAEESGFEAGWEDRRRRWCIDPVDGTKEFIAQNGEFAVMVGLADAGRAILGVILLPAQRILYYGGPDIGAFARRLPGGEDVPLQVSEIADPTAMTMAVSRSHRSSAVDTAAQRLGITREVVSGSVGIKLGMVAAAKVDLYLHPSIGTKLWDACAPEALVRGAGGILTDCRGRPIPYDGTDVQNRSGLVASNGRCHDRIIEALAPVVEDAGL
jgi:3'(2'), 5'-bisphosphate nucleotidase